MSNEYYAIVSEYIGIVTWFVVLIGAKLASLNSKKKLSKSEIAANITYCIVGGIMAYFGTAAFKYNIRVIAVGLGVMSGDVIVQWLPDSVKGWLKVIGTSISSWIKKKFK